MIRIRGVVYRDEDEAVDARRQSLLDAFLEGETAGRLNLSADQCPYYHFETEHDEWMSGRLRTLHLGGQQ